MCRLQFARVAHIQPAVIDVVHDQQLDVRRKGVLNRVEARVRCGARQANARSLLWGSDDPYILAQRGMRDLLAGAGATEDMLEMLTT